MAKKGFQPANAPRQTNSIRPQHRQKNEGRERDPQQHHRQRRQFPQHDAIEEERAAPQHRQHRKQRPVPRVNPMVAGRHLRLCHSGSSRCLLHRPQCWPPESRNSVAPAQVPALRRRAAEQPQSRLGRLTCASRGRRSAASRILRHQQRRRPDRTPTPASRSPRSLPRRPPAPPSGRQERHHPCRLCRPCRLCPPGRPEALAVPAAPCGPGCPCGPCAPGCPWAPATP